MSRPSLRDLTEADIQKQLNEARQEVFTLRLQQASGKLQNPARIVQIRRTIARLLTALRERTAAGGRA